MTGKPILFSGSMVRAILDGRKTQTRRVVKPQPTEYGLVSRTACDGAFSAWEDDGLTLDEGCQRVCPYGQPGDLLWVREAFYQSPMTTQIRYRADGEVTGWRPRPSIYLPRHLSRLTLRITDVRVQQLQDISEEDARAEGFPDPDGTNRQYADRARYWFHQLWDSINGKRGYSWESNPWVWTVTFEPIPHNIEEVQHDRS